MMQALSSKTSQSLVPLFSRRTVTAGTASATCLIVLSKLTINAHTSCERSVRQPPLYGKSVPFHLTSRNVASSSSIKSFNNQEKVVDGPKGMKEQDNDDIYGKISTKEEKKDCPLCKKYSRGPCGPLFQKWIDCIDGKEENDQSDCDYLLAPLDQCLKSHQAYYDKISLYNDDDNGESGDNGKHKDLLSTWKLFIEDLEYTQKTGNIKIRFKAFRKDNAPDMQLRPEQNMGAAMFRPNDGDGRILLLAYVKDDNGNLLGAGSVEDLFEFQSKLVLRFRVTSDCRNITAHGLYQNDDDSNHDGSETARENDFIIYRKTERIPPPS
jgi:hypothetical protein